MGTRKFTTFELSKICGVSVSTIVNWVESGKLKAYSTLGGHRRVSEQDLIDFLKQNNIPVPPEIISQTAKKILIVDDEEPILKYIEKLLQGSDIEYKTESAKNGFEAGDKINLFKPDTVILDVYLPGIDGFEVCRHIKERHPHIKVVAISGQNTEETKNKILEAGADVFIPKPFEPHVLLDELEK